LAVAPLVRVLSYCAVGASAGEGVRDGGEVVAVEHDGGRWRG
jgi:hypothetical protein